MDTNQESSPTSFISSPFDALRHEENGREYWLAYWTLEGTQPTCVQ